MEQNQKSKKGKIIAHSIAVFVIFAIYGFYIFCSVCWKGQHWFQVLNLFSEFPTPKEDPNYGLDMFLRILSLSFVILSITYLVRLFLNLVGPKFKRGKVLASLLSSFAKYLGAIILIFAILGTIGIDTTVLLASAGIISLIVGLGAQPLIEDIFAGIFIVFENTFEIGDIVVVDGFRGTVKEMGIRTTKIEDAGGDVKVINNSDIRTMINMTSKLSVAVCDVSISYDEDIEKVENLLKDYLPKIKENHSEIMEGPSYVGVQSLADSGVVLRIIAECNESDRYQVQRVINREIKILFDQNHITIPYPQMVIHKDKNSK